MSKIVLDTATGGLYVTITSQVVVYASAERALTFSLILKFSLSQKGPNKKWSGWTNLRPNFGRFGTKRAKKGPNFKTIVSLFCKELATLYSISIIYLTSEKMEKGGNGGLQSSEYIIFS